MTSETHEINLDEALRTIGPDAAAIFDNPSSLPIEYDETLYAAIDDEDEEDEEDDDYEDEDDEDLDDEDLEDDEDEDEDEETKTSSTRMTRMKRMKMRMRTRSKPLEPVSSHR